MSPSPVKWLNLLLFVENLLGIYRSYCTQKNTIKYLIILQIIVQTLLHTVFVIYEAYLLLAIEDYRQQELLFAFFAAIACVKSVSSIVISLCFSRDFIAYYISVSRVYECLKDDPQLKYSLNKVLWIGIIVKIIFFPATVFKTSQNLIKFLPSHPILHLVPILVSQAIIKSTVIFEFLMLFVVIMIVVYLLKSLTSLVSTVQESVISCGISTDEQCDITREKIQKWVELYRELANCCEKVSLCFGRQYFFILVLTLSQYIFVTYQIVYITVYNLRDSLDYMRIVMLMLNYITVMLMPLVAGQIAKNQGVKFHRVLVRLYNTVIDSDKAEVKLLKDFIRLMKKNPIEIRLLSKVPVGAYILPVTLSFAVNYVIVMLQFNHVI